MGIRPGVGEVVDDDDVKLVRVQVVDGFVDLAADAAEPVDAYADGHGDASLMSSGLLDQVYPWHPVNGQVDQGLSGPGRTQAAAVSRRGAAGTG